MSLERTLRRRRARRMTDQEAADRLLLYLATEFVRTHDVCAEVGMPAAEAIPKLVEMVKTGYLAVEMDDPKTSGGMVRWRIVPTPKWLAEMPAGTSWPQ